MSTMLNDWPPPDESLLPDHQTPPPRLPIAIFGAWTGWISHMADRKNAPADYIALSLLVVAAGSIGNSYEFAPWDDWTEPCILWGACVGRPSAQKSPAMDSVLAPLRSVEAELVSEWERASAAIEEDAAQPGRPRLIVNDVTSEKAASILSDDPRGFLMHRDELGGWIGNLDKYGGGKGDRFFWIEAYGGRAYTMERQKFDDPIRISRLSISILGAVQPDTLEELFLRSREDGLVPRFIAVWPDPVPLRRPVKLAAAPQDIERALMRLRTLSRDDVAKGSRRIPFSAEAADTLHAFRVEINRLVAGTEGLLESWLGKASGLCVRAAGVLTFLDWSVGIDTEPPGEIGRDAVERAIQYVRDYVYPMARHVFGAAATPAEERAARVLARWISIEPIQEFTVRDIVNMRWRGLRKANETKLALDMLIQAGWIRHMPEQTGGRPRDVYRVNPRLSLLILT